MTAHVCYVFVLLLLLVKGENCLLVCMILYSNQFCTIKLTVRNAFGISPCILELSVLRDIRGEKMWVSHCLLEKHNPECNLINWEHFRKCERACKLWGMSVYFLLRVWIIVRHKSLCLTSKALQSISLISADRLCKTMKQLYERVILQCGMFITKNPLPEEKCRLYFIQSTLKQRVIRKLPLESVTV